MGLVSRPPETVLSFVSSAAGRVRVRASRCLAVRLWTRRTKWPAQPGWQHGSWAGFRLRRLHLKRLLFRGPVPTQHLPPSGLGAWQAVGKASGPTEAGAGDTRGCSTERSDRRAAGGSDGGPRRDAPVARVGGGFFRWDRLKEVTRGWHEACRLWTGRAEWTAGCCCCQSRA